MRISSLDISLRAICLLPMLALGACDPKLQLGKISDELQAGDSEGTGGQTDTTEAGSGGQTDPVEDSSGAPPESTTTGASGTTGGDSGAPVTACDSWTQDCPGANQKCVPYADDGGDQWNALKCVEIDPAPVPVGTPCLQSGTMADPDDNCEKGAICWNVDLDTNMGTCVAQCQGSPNEPICGAGTSCGIFNDGILPLCLPDCDPLGQDCGADELCAFVGDFWSCVDDASGDEGQVFDTCEYVNVCDPGLFCGDSLMAVECDPNSIGCCLPLCDVNAPNTCPGANQVCSPWYEDGQAPVGQENLGACTLPN